MTSYEFQGDPDRRTANPHKDSPDGPEPYIADPELARAVNLAIYLRRPLLLEGEAGCGKTRLAAAVAYELGLPFYRWNVRSNSKAEEGLYKYDAILRLHDVQAAKGGIEIDRDPQDARAYRDLGALGKAFQLETCPAVVLIDEIDKADLDFPNDLLTVMEEPWSFKIRETGETIAATPGNEPIVIVTSNKEKGNLPAPFLRRCLYYFIDFPSSAERLQAIAAAHNTTARYAEELVRAAAEKFLEIRNSDRLFKNPGTSEFLDWLRALSGFGRQSYPIAKLREEALPYRELLLKRRDDWTKYAPAP